jgi:predicted DNA-binding protein (UPF0251 family)/predicted Fe-Mo cluster-binding NifX family protein
VFCPRGIGSETLESVTLSLDELEAIRLADLRGLYQEAAAREMGVSRQTFGRIIESARRKTAEALLGGKALKIEGGKVRLKTEGDRTMKIAVPSKGQEIDQHFGHCEKYSVFTVEGNAIVSEETMASTVSCGCKSGIAATLAENGVKLLLAGGIGDGAIRVLGANGIETVKGAKGNARAAVEQYLRGELIDTGDVCHEHGEGHELPLRAARHNFKSPQ